MLLGDIKEGFPEEVMFDEGKACTQDKVGEGNLGKGLSCANVRTNGKGCPTWGPLGLQRNHSLCGEVG